MNRFLRCLVTSALLALSVLAAPAQAAVNCSLSIAPVPLQGIYNWTGNLDIQGSFTVTCTRAPSDPKGNTIWLGLNQPAGGLSMPRDIGGGSLDFTIYRKTFGTAVWTDFGSEKAASNANGALSEKLDFKGANTVESDTYNFYFRIPAFQIVSPAGVYVSAPIAVTVRQDDAAGPLFASGFLSTLISIPNHCRFSSDPAPVSLTYPAFSPVPVVRTSSFGVICTQGTNYTLSLDATAGVVPNVELNYAASLSAGGTQVGSAMAQGFDVTFTFPAGQAGRCSAASCVGTGTRTITVTY